jgi:uncharacterized membrane protein YheB (UPF0754 family)
MIEISIKPEDINDQLSKAVMESTIGVMIKDAIHKVLKQDYTARNIVEEAVKASVASEVRTIVMEKLGEHKDELKKMVADKFTEGEMERIVGRIYDIAVKHI